MKKIIYVTGNYGKYVSVKECFIEKNIDIDFYKYDFEEIEINDIEKISRKKALDAYDILQTPCFVADTGFYIDDYPNNPGYPGAFVKRSGISSNIDELLEYATEKKAVQFTAYLLEYKESHFKKGKNALDSLKL